MTPLDSSPPFLSGPDSSAAMSSISLSAVAEVAALFDFLMKFPDRSFSERSVPIRRVFPGIFSAVLVDLFPLSHSHYSVDPLAPVLLLVSSFLSQASLSCFSSSVSFSRAFLALSSSLFCSSLFFFLSFLSLLVLAPSPAPSPFPSLAPFVSSVSLTPGAPFSPYPPVLFSLSPSASSLFLSGLFPPAPFSSVVIDLSFLCPASLFVLLFFSFLCFCLFFFLFSRRW